MNDLLSNINDFLWTYVLIGALLACGIYFTWRTRFVQFRMVGEMVRLLGDSVFTGGGKGGRHVSSFQAFAVSVATRVGSGNLAGVATAIALGGPGAVFWMWVTAILGASTSLVESTLSQLFKRRHRESFVGGPAYYIRSGLRCGWMSRAFAWLMVGTFALSYNSIQSNTIAGAMQEAFSLSPVLVGAVVSVLSLLIIFGGIRRIARFSSVIVPLMALGYLVLALVVIARNIGLFPDVLALIVRDAFGMRQAAGGLIGATMLHGVRRGLFSNEAGEGSTPNVAASASVSHPVKQGLIQALGVFTDTLIVCSCTAFIVIISGLYTVPGAGGIALTQLSLEAEIGPAGPVFVALAILLFAFSSIVGNYYYGEANVRFLTSRELPVKVLRVLSRGVAVFAGAVSGLETVWNVGDICMALLTGFNLVAIVPLGRYAFRLLDDYREQKRRGVREPVFYRDTLPELSDADLCWPSSAEDR